MNKQTIEIRWQFVCVDRENCAHICAMCVAGDFHVWRHYFFFYCIRCQFSLHLCVFAFLFMHITLYLHKVIEVQNSFVWIPLPRRERDGAMKKSESICKYGFDCTEIKKVEHPECVCKFLCVKTAAWTQTKWNWNEMTSTWEIAIDTAMICETRNVTITLLYIM